jgi:hypothetical protein
MECQVVQLWSPIHGSIYRVWVRSGQRDEPVGGVGIFRTDGITMKHQASPSGQSNRTFHYSIVRSRGLLFGCLRQVLPGTVVPAAGQANRIAHIEGGSARFRVLRLDCATFVVD